LCLASVMGSINVSAKDTKATNEMNAMNANQESVEGKMKQRLKKWVSLFGLIVLMSVMPAGVMAEEISAQDVNGAGVETTSNSVQERQIFSNMDIGGGTTGIATSPTFTITEPYAITLIEDYHYLGFGQPAGTIGLYNQDDIIYGPWQALLDNGNYWVINNKNPGHLEDFRRQLGMIDSDSTYPVLPAGTYTVIDSDPFNWSHNAQKGNYGFSHILGYKVSDVTNPLVSIGLNKTTENLQVGGSDTLIVSYNPVDTTDDKTVAWSSSDAEVATVDDQGNVNAIKAGTAIITATVGALDVDAIKAGTAINTATVLEATCDYTVTPIPIPLISISVSKTAMTLIEGDSQTLTVTYNPVDTTDNKAVTWTSSADSIATVDSSGNVIAISPGTATITATVGGKISTCEVTVQQTGFISVTGLLLDANGNPLANTRVELHSDPMYATTDANGYFTFNNVPLGQHTFYVKSNDGETVAEMTINIIQGESYSYDNSTGEIIIKNGAGAVTVTIKLAEGDGIEITGIAEGNNTPAASQNKSVIETIIKASGINPKTGIVSDGVAGVLMGAFVIAILGGAIFIKRKKA